MVFIYFLKNYLDFSWGFMIQFDTCSYFFNWVDTVDGKHPAPVHMVNIRLFTRFYTSQVVQDFFHQQYHQLGVSNELEMPSEELIPRWQIRTSNRIPSWHSKMMPGTVNLVTMIWQSFIFWHKWTGDDEEEEDDNHWQNYHLSLSLICYCHLLSSALLFLLYTQICRM